MWDTGWGAWLLCDAHMMAGELVLVSECPFGMSSESFFRFRPAAGARPWKCGSKADYQLQIPEPTSLGVNTAIAVCWCMCRWGGPLSVDELVMRWIEDVVVEARLLLPLLRFRILLTSPRLVDWESPPWPCLPVLSARQLPWRGA